MFNPSNFENSRADGFGVLEILNTPSPSHSAPPSAMQRFVPLKESRLTGEIAGPLADLQLTQLFSYSRTELNQVIEAVYRFPLPGDAAVTRVVVRFGDVEIVAELKERNRAEEEFEAAKVAGQQAALATRESPDVFTLQVAGIQPDQPVTVETSYVQLAQPQGVDWRLRTPLTTAPRFVREDELNSHHANGQPLAVLRDPGHRFSLALNVYGANRVTSPTHSLQLEDIRNALGDDNITYVTLEAGTVLPDRDLVLQWTPTQDTIRPNLSVLTHEDTETGHVYFLANISPPSQHDLGSGVPRDVTLLVDHSGSMIGAKWSAADWTVERFLYDLTNQDAFALGSFQTSTKWYRNQLLQADDATVGNAVSWLVNDKDSGGTNLGVALEQALGFSAIQNDRFERSRHVLIVTDAAVSDSGRILRLADGEADNPLRRRISVLTIDAAPNAFLATELAARGGGIAKFLTSQPDADDITTALDEVLMDWSEPVHANVKLIVNRDGVETASHTVEELSAHGANTSANTSANTGVSAIDIGDLPSGRSIWVAGRVEKGNSTNLMLQLQTSIGEIASTNINLRTSVNDHPALKALFGARRVNGIEFLINSSYSGTQLRDQLARLGYDPAVVLQKPSSDARSAALYAENQQAANEAALKHLLVSEALSYGLASSETAFVAVRAESGQPIEATVAVGSALPAGWSDHFLSQPRSIGATRGMKRSMMPANARTRSVGSGVGSLDMLVERAVDSSQGATRGGLPPSPASMPLPAGFPQPSGLPQPAIQPQTSRSVLGPDAGQGIPIFTGTPDFEGESPSIYAVLYDTSFDFVRDQLPSVGTMTGLQIRLSEDASGWKPNRNVVMQIFVGDMASPRARIRMSDLLRNPSQVRPLNIQRNAGDEVRVVLMGLTDTLVGNAPAFTLQIYM